MSLYILLEDFSSLDDKTLVAEYKAAESVFSDVTDLACAMLYEGRWYASKTKDVDYGDLKQRLDDINIDYLMIRHDNNQCQISLSRHVTGFAGKGYSYKFHYNRQSPQLFDPVVHDKENWKAVIASRGEDVFAYDIPLSNNWYLTFTQS
ncbi:hypothetical protein [Thalassotalea sp. Y01]|uniref:hypothetical protein n=1 Tax=Thalassotalea sp. Y01 TaxID=2729613 RepID=UPI00145D0AF5|nr:hypothetical protein [Thalassotalea sp. Y01]NMP16772.1 hypothetical protein [Thalassotalea sp. Y01]